MSTSSTTPKLTITYFPISGRAEPIRLACAVSKIPFTNKAISPAEFQQAKPTLPLGQLPVLDLDFGATKKTLTQTTAMLRYVGKLGGLYPIDDDVSAMEVDEILSVLDDLREPLVLTIKGAVRGLLSDDKQFTNEEKIAIRERWMKKTLPHILGFIEKKLLLNTSSGWLVGKSMSIADLALYCDLDWVKSGILDGIPTNVLDSYPACLKLIENVTNHDDVKKWKEMYPKPYATFDYEP